MLNRHFSRGTRVGVAQKRSRTVSDRGAVVRDRRADRREDLPGDASVCFSSTMKEKRTRPSTFAAGASSRTKGGWTSNCQPTHTSGVSLFHQEAVAEVGRGSRILTCVRAAIEAPEESFAPAIGDLEQQRAVALLRVNRSKDVQVGGEVHAAI